MKRKMLSTLEQEELKQKEFLGNMKKEMEDQRKLHHPYCWITYLESRVSLFEWNCICKHLKSYDQWRKDMA